MDFTQLAQARHSANNFDPDVHITERQLKVIFDTVKLAPSAFNLQPATFQVVMNDQQKKDALQRASGGQYKVGAASAVVVVTTNTEAYKETARLNAGAVMLGIMSEQELDDMVATTAHYYEDQGQAFQQFDAVRNASLFAMQFMLAAKNEGWDTCPVSYDDAIVRETLQLAPTEQVVFMLVLGKEKTTHPRMRGYRKPFSEMVKIY